MLFIKEYCTEVFTILCGWCFIDGAEMITSLLNEFEELLPDCTVKLFIINLVASENVTCVKTLFFIPRCNKL